MNLPENCGMEGNGEAMRATSLTLFADALLLLLRKLPK
jgi:hypothetical protein